MTPTATPDDLLEQQAAETAEAPTARTLVPADRCDGSASEQAKVLVLLHVDGQTMDLQLCSHHYEEAAARLAQLGAEVHDQRRE